MNPQIGVNPDGLVQVEWSIGGRGGTLAMVFLPSGFIRFAAISAPAQRGVESTRISGTLPKSETMGAIRPFTDSSCTLMSATAETVTNFAVL